MFKGFELHTVISKIVLWIILYH